MKGLVFVLTHQYLFRPAIVAHAEFPFVEIHCII